MTEVKLEEKMISYKLLEITFEKKATSSFIKTITKQSF
jgi:hypothetical protein